MPDSCKMSEPAAEGSSSRVSASLLGKHPFLAGMKAEHLQLLAENAMRTEYQQGEFLIRAGDPANRFYLIESGKISLELNGKENPEAQVQTISAGDVLGWSWLFPPYYWQFDARALEPTTAIFLYGTRLREYCEMDHDLGFELMKRMAEIVVQRLQATRKQLLAATSRKGR